MVTLTESDILSRTEAATLDDVRSLNLWGLGLTDVSLLAKLPNLEVLSLSVNSVTTLEPFAQLAKLQELYARKNSIASLAELRHLAKCRHLRSLWLVDNPCAVGLDKEEYRLRVLRALPQLETLDNCEVTTHERLLTSSGDGELEAYLQTRKKPPVSSPVASTTPLRSPERRHTQQLHAPGPRTVPRGTTWASILDTPPAEVKQLKQPQTGGGPAGGAAGVATYSSPRVNALYAVLALLPTLGREELSAVERDVHARLGALQAA